MLVYHFLEACWAEDDLAKERLKISRFDDLNDPFELLAPELKDRANHKDDALGVLGRVSKAWRRSAGSLLRVAKTAERRVMGKRS